MLTIERCRQLLGSECTLTDEEVKNVRDQLRVIAEIALDHCAHTDGDGTA